MKLGWVNTSFTASQDWKIKRHNKTSITFSSKEFLTFQTCKKSFYSTVSVSVTDGCFVIMDTTCFTIHG